MKILIVTYYFPPLNKVASLRPYSWAKYWSRTGHEVRVLTAKKEPYDGLLNLNVDYADMKSVRIEEMRYFSFRKYKKPQHSIERKLHTGPCFSVRTRMKQFIKRLTGINLYSPHPWILPAFRTAYKMYMEWPYHIIVSTYGPPACHIVAGLIKRRLPVFWAADYRDLWYGSSLLTGKWPFSSIERIIENFFVRKADLISTVSEPWMEKLATRFGREVITIENGFDAEDLNTISKEPLFPDDGKIRLVYTGTLYLERQKPEPLFKAIALLKKQGFPVETRIEVIFYGVKRLILQKLIKEYELDTVIKTPGSVGRKIALRAQRDADMLIFFDWVDISFKGMLTAKIYEYMYSGTPVLCIGMDSDTSAVRLIKEAGIGFTVGMSDKMIKDIIKKLLSGEKLNYSPLPEILAKYTREKLSEKMLEIIIKRL